MSTTQAPPDLPEIPAFCRAKPHENAWAVRRADGSVIDANTHGSPASPFNPSTWATLETARSRRGKGSDFVGLAWRLPLSRQVAAVEIAGEDPTAEELAKRLARAGAWVTRAEGGFVALSRTVLPPGPRATRAFVLHPTHWFVPMGERIAESGEEVGTIDAETLEALLGLEEEAPAPEETAQAPSNGKHPLEVETTTGLPPSESVPGRRFLTDLGNAERLADELSGRILFDHRRGAWRYWRAGCWHLDDSDRVPRRAASVFRGIYREIPKRATEEERDRILRHARRSEGAKAVRDALILARGLTPFSCTGDEFDRNGELLGVRNGILDLRTFELYKATPEEMLTKQVRVPFRPEAQSELLDRFLEDITGGDGDLCAFLARAVGSSLLGVEGSMRRLFLLVGPTCSGKTTLLELARHVLGPYARPLPWEEILEKERGGPGPRPELAKLPGVRLAVASEPPRKGRLNGAVLKPLLGGDTLSVHGKYGHPFDLAPVCDVWAACNLEDLPEIPDDPALFTRLVAAPFRNPHDEESLVDDLSGRLQREAGEAFLAWAVAGLLDYRERGGLQPPPAVLAETERLRTAANPLAAWASARLVFEEGRSASGAALAEDYTAWCNSHGTPPVRTAGRDAPFAPLLRRLARARGMDPTYDKHLPNPEGGQTRGWRGIGFAG